MHQPSDLPTMPHIGASTQTGRLTAVIARTIACFLITLLVFTMSYGKEPAHAYNQQAMIDYAGWQVGSMQLEDGTHVYCLEPGTLTPMSALQSAQVVDTLRGYSIRTVDSTGWSGVVSTVSITGVPLKRINYLLSTYGQDADPRVRVAVQLAVWALRAGTGEGAWLEHHTRWVNEHGGAWEVARSQQLIAESQVASEQESFEIPDLKLNWDDPENETGVSGTVEYPVGTRSVALTGATFSDGNDVKNVDPTVTGSLSWRVGHEQNVWAHEVVVSATGSVDVPVQVWPAQLMSYPPSDPVQQTQGAGYGPIHETVLRPFPVQKIERHLELTPEFVTSVPTKLLNPGDGVFEDTVTVSAPKSQKWPKRKKPNGEYEFFPITLTGNLYGPFGSVQSIGTEPPEGAQVVDVVHLQVHDGPGEYIVRSSEQIERSGYYYWQWRMSEGEQSDRSGVIPTGYTYFDRFGEPAEQQAVRMKFEIETDLQHKPQQLGPQKIEDLITVSAGEGEWLQSENGEPAPLTLRQSVYRSEVQPVRAAEVPQNAELISEHNVAIAGGAQSLRSGEMLLPDGFEGWVTVRTCVRQEDQVEEFRDYVVERCDDYGVPSETIQVFPKKLPITGSDSWLNSSVIVCVSCGSLVLGAMLICHRNRQKTSRCSSNSA